MKFAAPGENPRCCPVSTFLSWAGPVALVPRLLCGSELIPAPDFRGKADPMPFPSCTAAVFSVSTFLRGFWHDTFQNAFPALLPFLPPARAPLPWPGPVLLLTESACHSLRQVLLFSAQTCSVSCSFPPLRPPLPYCPAHTRTAGGFCPGCGSTGCLPFSWLLCL